MDALRPGHAHRSSSDRLLNNYLDSQKHLTTSLLTLLSHSHSSTSSLLAYTTSSPGVLLSVRRAVRYAAFEGPISPSLHETTAGSTLGGADTGTPGWAAYISSLEQFRKDLKQIHLLEEEMSRVKRDREILVTRLIKTTKSRPTKSDIKEIATSYTHNSQVMSSGGSTYSASSDASVNGKESKRAGKLAEAQAELLGCEEHLRALEIRIESERNKVMYRGLEERFRAMEVVAQMWLAQAHRGLEDLEKLPNLPTNAYELDSNGSLAPSQSASQVGAYDDHGSSPRRPLRLHDTNGPGSITDSIQEEEEGESSGEDNQGTLVMHENRPTKKSVNGNPAAPIKSSPLASPQQANYPAPSGPPPASSNKQAVGRRAVSEVGHAPRAYSPVNHAPLRRTLSNGHQPLQRVTSPAGSSVRSRGSVRKRGFFAAIARFFKGPSKHQRGHHGGRGGVLNRRDGAESPPYGSGSRPGSAWQTRTNDNLNRSRSVGRRTRSDSSSDEDDMRNLVQVSNQSNRDSGFSVADIGRVPYNPNPKATPTPITRSASTKSKSTITTRSIASGAATPKARPASQAGTAVSRSNTVKSTASTVKTTATAKSAGTVKSTTKAKPAANGTTERNRKNGSIARSASTRSNGPTIMSIVDSAPPPMPDVPKAPRSLVSPQLELAKAPGSSLTGSATMPSMILPSQVMNGSVPRTRDALGDELRPQDSISRSNSYRRPKSSEVPREEPRRPVSPLPPSKSRQPPLKSALRPSSPSPQSPSEPPPVITTLYSISAPGPVELPPDEPQSRPSIGSRPSYASTGDQTSIYESAVEDDFNDFHEPEESDDESTELGDAGFQVVENDRLSKSPEGAAPIASEHAHEHLSDLPQHEDEGAGVVRRKSVRMNLPASSSTEHLDHDKGLYIAPPGIFEERPYDRSYTAPDDDDSPPGTPRASGQWSTRIGHLRDDTSEEEDLDPAYTKARRGLIRSHSSKTDDKKSKRSSSKSKGSVRSRLSKGK
ncbi:hypothetical protein Q8F55_001766 [Vanrija albida]|uniref:Uncharacterized protein n=1 Tax=Vanrija albida TaxID=181172 RepID=A0ABR3Q8Z4_9TREE